MIKLEEKTINLFVSNEVAKIYENRYNDTYNKVISKIFTK